MTLTAILARADDDTIGVDGTLPWRLPPDLRRFKELTTGHAVIMGRKTFDSIGRALPNRKNIVMTRGERAPADGVVFVPTAAAALALATLHDPDPFVIGGASVYDEFWPIVDRVELTEVHAWTLQWRHEKCDGTGLEPMARTPCVVKFGIDRSAWRETFRSEEQTHERLRFHFVTLERK